MTGRRLGERAAWWIYPAVMAALALAPGRSPAEERTTPPREGFGPGKLWQIHLTLPAKEYEAMQPRSSRRGFPWFGGATAKPADPRPVHRNNFGMDLPLATGTVTLDGQTFADVAVRYKGNGTLGDASRTIKKSLKIELGEAGRFRGLKTINLHCEVADPSKCRETLGYALYRAAGVAAPRTALAEVRLTVPGKYDRELLGVYTVVEQIDKPFLRAFFGSEKGLLMKPEGMRDFEHKSDDWARYKDRLKPKRAATDDEARRLVAFARLVDKAGDDEFRAAIGSFLDIDAYLRFLAVTAFIVNPDCFFVLGHNYYLYLHPATRRLHFFPWDLDRSFANFPILGSNRRQMNLSFVHPYPGTHRLSDRLMAMPGVADRYRQLLRDLSASVFAVDRLRKEVATAEAAVAGLLAADEKAARARQEGPYNPPASFGKPPPLRMFVDKRTESLTAQLAGRSTGHVPAGVLGPGGFRAGDFAAGPLIDALGHTEDGQLTRAEWLAGVRKAFDAAAKDASGRIDETGLAVALNGLIRGGKGGPPPQRGFGNLLAGPFVRRADADRDGKLTLAELTTTAAQLFDTADRGKAGRIDEPTFAALLNSLATPPAADPPADPTKEKTP